MFSLKRFKESQEPIRIGNCEILSFSGIGKSTSVPLEPLAEMSFNFKSDLSDILVDRIKPMTSEIKKLMKDKRYLLEILMEGQNKANEVAQKTINDVYDIVGLIRNET